MMKGSNMTAINVKDEDYLFIVGGRGPPSNNTPPQPGAQYSENIIGNQHCNEVHMYRLKTGQYNMILGL